MVEPAPTLVRDHRLAMAPTLVDATSNCTVKVRVMNSTHDPVSVKQDALLGHAGDIVGVEDTVLQQEDSGEADNYSCIRRSATKAPHQDEAGNPEDEPMAGTHHSQRQRDDLQQGDSQVQRDEPQEGDSQMHGDKPQQGDDLANATDPQGEEDLEINRYVDERISQAFRRQDNPSTSVSEADTSLVLFGGLKAAHQTLQSASTLEVRKCQHGKETISAIEGLTAAILKLEGTIGEQNAVLQQINQRVSVLETSPAGNQRLTRRQHSRRRRRLQQLEPSGGAEAQAPPEKKEKNDDNNNAMQ